MNDKQILVVDDDKFILTFLEHSLHKLEPTYHVITVDNGIEALEKLHQQEFDLVITDYLMPGISGIDLMNAIRHVAPTTSVVLMTAYATDQLHHTLELLHVDGYIRKPLNLSQMRKVIRRTIGSRPHEKAPPDTERLDKDINKYLQTLFLNTGARFVMLVASGGHSVQVVGPAEKDETTKVAMLVAANFLAATRLTRLLDSSSSYKSTSFESDTNHIYAYHVNDEFLLAVVFGKQTKSGVVSIYTKQAAEALALIVNQIPNNQLVQEISLKLELETANGTHS